jgi:hypothetical protein
VNADNLSTLYQNLRAKVDVRQGLHDTFYGMREFIIRDINGFWVTFGQSITEA